MSIFLSRPTALTTPTPCAPLSAIALAMWLTSPSMATAANTLPEVEVAETAARALEGHITAYDRSELLSQGDASLAEVLRRLPGVSIDSEGYISLRGMGQGRTQVLIDDKPLVSGSGDASLAGYPLSVVERVEIVRGASAQDTGAIAGSIRITTRRASAAPERTARLRLGFSPSGQFEHHASVNLGGAQAQWQWQLNAELSHKEQLLRKRTLTHTGGFREIADIFAYFPIEEREVSTLRESASMRQAILSGDVALQATTRDRLSLRWNARLEPDAMRDTEARDLTQITPANVHHNGSFGGSSSSRSPNWYLSPTLHWQRELAQGGQLQAQWGFTRAQSIYRYQVQRHDFGYNTSDPQYNYTNDNSSAERLVAHKRDNHAALQWQQPLGAGHRVQAGARWDKERLASATSSEGYEFWQAYGDPYASPSAWSEGWSENTSRTTQASYAQWSWQPSSAWSAQAGVRHERQALNAPSDAGEMQRRANGLWLPSLNVSFAPEAGPRWHFNAAQTYRAPALESLQDNRRRRTGSIQSPDLMGNAQLRNEVSTGIELGLSESLQRGTRTVGEWHANVFARRIRHSQTQELQLQDVPYCDDNPACGFEQRWTLTPMNRGTTHVKGLEVGGRYDVAQLPVSLHADVVLTQSRVAGQAAPARLNGQTPLQINIGWDVRTTASTWLPDQWGTQLRYEASYDTRLNPSLPAHIEAMTSWHLHALWKLADDTRLRAQFIHGSDWRTHAYLKLGRDESTHIQMQVQRPWQAAVQLEHDF